MFLTKFFKAFELNTRARGTILSSFNHQLKLPLSIFARKVNSIHSSILIPTLDKRYSIC